VAAGSTATVTYNLFNSGFAASSATVHFYLSTTPRINGTSIYLGSQPVTNLDAFSYFIQESAFQFRATLRQVSYYVVWTWISGVPEYETHSSEDSQAAITNGLLTVLAGPDLTITKSHTTHFRRGQAATYAITVRNSGEGSTNGDVTVSYFAPFHLTAASISGSGWSCSQPAGPCTRADVLQPGANYPPIRLAVNVGENAPSEVTNMVTVAGGGDIDPANNNAGEPTPMATDAVGTPKAVTGGISIVVQDAAGVGFNDTTAASPVGGNTGTTLGQQRLMVVQAAANKWASTLNSTVAIRISGVGRI